MRPPTDHELILHYYGESDDPERLGRAIEESPEVAARYRALRRVLDAIPEPETPEPGTDYAEQLWRRLEPQVHPRTSHRRSDTVVRASERRPAPRRRSRLLPTPDRRWALAAAAVVLLVGAFLLGRLTSPPSAGPGAGETRTAAADARQRILLVTVADHLERSELLLLELANARPGDPAAAPADGGDAALDLSAERRLADRLSGDNRVYRQAAERAGETRIVHLLDELERLLLELSHAPEELDAEELEELRRRLDERGLLFRVRVVGSGLRRETGTGTAAAEEAPPARDV